MSESKCLGKGSLFAWETECHCGLSRAFTDEEVQVAFPSCGRGGVPVPGPFMGTDLDLVRSNIMKSVAPATLAAYSSPWRMWLAHVSSMAEDELAFSEGLVLSFLNKLLASTVSWSQVNKTLAGVSFFGKLNNHPPCSSFFSVKQALKGYRKGAGSKDSRMAITPAILAKLCSATELVCFFAL